MQLSRFISNGMVIQRNKKAHVWGYDEPGRRISVCFLNKDYETTVKEDGCFDVWLDEANYGGPYEMLVRNDVGEAACISDILIGEVWVCSGQSNMELPMNRVKDRYPEEMINCDYPEVRCFKIIENLEYITPLSEPLTGEWKKPSKECIGEFSATSYFFARELNRITGIPVGFINLSLGGSKIHCWMSRRMLEGYDDKLKQADKYGDDDFRKSVLKNNEEGVNAWHAALDARDNGLKEEWTKECTDDSAWEEVELPNFFKDTPVGNTIGCIYFRKSFTVPEEMVGKPAKLWLGTIVDSDKTYVNGEFVGEILYQYPPRKYEIREGLLHAGINNVTVRVKAENNLPYLERETAAGRFTKGPGKKYAIFNESGEINLTGTWKFKIGAECEPAYQVDFVNWKPTCLYNGMTAPCHKYVIGGFTWYQGESDCEESYEYQDQFNRMVRGYREEWKDETLPFNVVQLPNFTIDNNPDSDAWNRMRETLRVCAEQMELSDSIVTIDLGEDNDLHPQGKRELGRRLALLAANKNCGCDVECYGPMIDKLMCVKRDGYVELTLIMSHIGDGLCAKAANFKGEDGRVTDFAVCAADGKIYNADALVLDNKIILKVPGLNSNATQIRYCYSQTNSGALIYNSYGLPMSPGIYEI